MSGALDQIDILQKEIIALQPIQKEWQQKIDKKFRLEFNYNSNHMEGNTLTYGETKLLLIFDETKGSHNIREYDEMRNHDVAFRLVEEWAKDKERILTEQNIKNLNEIILVKSFWKEAITPDGQPTRRLIKIGNYKEFPNSVRLQNGGVFEYTSPTDTPIEMSNLMEWYRAEEKVLHPVTLATVLHYKLVRIHPFDDGNGRVARLLMNYVLLRNGFPPVVIRSNDKANYLRTLHLADIGDYEPLIEYVAEQLIWSQQIVLKGAKGESVDEPGDFGKRFKFLQNRLNADGKLEVRVKKSKYAIINAWDTAIIILLKKINEELQRLGSWFKTTSQDTEVNPFSFVGPNPPADFESMSSFLEIRTLEIDNINITFRFIELRQAPSISTTATIEIIFHTNVYDLRCDGLQKVINKRYDDTFDEAELEYITESIGNHVISAIEKHLDKKKF